MTNVSFTFLRRLASRRPATDHEPRRSPADDEARAWFWIGFLIGTCNAIAVIGFAYMVAHL